MAHTNGVDAPKTGPSALLLSVTVAVLSLGFRDSLASFLIVLFASFVTLSSVIVGAAVLKDRRMRRVFDANPADRVPVVAPSLLEQDVSAAMDLDGRILNAITALLAERQWKRNAR